MWLSCTFNWLAQPWHTAFQSHHDPTRTHAIFRRFSPLCLEKTCLEFSVATCAAGADPPKASDLMSEFDWATGGRMEPLYEHLRWQYFMPMKLHVNLWYLYGNILLCQQYIIIIITSAPHVSGPSCLGRHSISKCLNIDEHLDKGHSHIIPKFPKHISWLFSTWIFLNFQESEAPNLLMCKPSAIPSHTDR